MTTSNNPSGRPKNSKNKTTKETKEILKNFIDYALNDMITIYDSLGNRDKVNLITRVLPFVMPKQIEAVEETEEKDHNITITYVPPEPYPEHLKHLQKH